MENIAQICWKKVLGVFDAHLAIVPLEYGTKIRDRKETVVEVCSDSAVKLPDAKLSTLATRAAWEYGHTEGSRHLNVIFHGAK